MSSNGAEVSSLSLRGLKDALNGLSNQIKGICDTLNSDRDRLGEAWRDQKFQDFKQGFQKQIDKCSGIADKYHQWGISVLEPAIVKVETIEKADVVGDGSSYSGAVSGSGSGPVGAGGSNGLAQDSAAQAGASQGPRIVPRPKNNTQAMKNEAGSNSATDFPTGAQSVRMEEVVQEPSMTEIKDRSRKESSMYEIVPPSKPTYDNPCPKGFKLDGGSLDVSTENINQKQTTLKHEDAQNNWSFGAGVSGGVEKSTNPLESKVKGEAELKAGYNREGEKDTTTTTFTEGTKVGYTGKCIKDDD